MSFLWSLFYKVVVFLAFFCANVAVKSQKCDQADVYPSSVSEWLFICLCILPYRLWAELDLAVFVGQQQWEKSSPAYKTTFPLILVLPLLRRAKLLSGKTPKGQGDKGRDRSQQEEGYLTEEKKRRWNIADHPVSSQHNVSVSLCRVKEVRSEVR